MVDVMRYLFLIIIQLLSLGKTDCQVATTLRQAIANGVKRNVSVRLYDLKILEAAKTHLINGDIGRAKFLLRRIDRKKSKVGPIKSRYLAIINFLEGKYNESLKLLNDPVFSENNVDKTKHAEICILKISNLLILNRTRELPAAYFACKRATAHFSKNRQLWPRTIINLKLGRSYNIEKTMFLQNLLRNRDMARIWSKLALFTNNEKKIAPYLSDVPEEFYRSKRVRELFGLIYYRLGNNQKAFSYVEDITSANAENIKGNINLEKKEYELAFGHFLLALKKRPNSQNAQERAIPLAWILERWDDGADILNKRIVSKENEKNKISLLAAFMIRQKKFAEAEKMLRLVTFLFNDNPPVKIDIMNSYLSIIQSKKNTTEIHSAKACRKFDGFNCWMYMQTQIWPDLKQTIGLDVKTWNDSSLTIEILKKKVGHIPLVEDAVLDQEDIEKLDTERIEL